MSDVKTSLQKIARDLRYMFGWELTPDQVLCKIANIIPYILTITATLMFACVLYFGRNAFIIGFVVAIMIIGLKIKVMMLAYREHPEDYEDNYNE